MAVTTIRDVIQFLDDFAPPCLAEDWDNTGLLVGHPDGPVSSAMTCLTLTEDVAAEAIEKRVQLIVSHHPVLFRAVQKLTPDSADGRVLLPLIENKIGVFSPHTRFDSAAAGINQQLAESFELESIQPLKVQEDTDGLGSGRMGVLPEPVDLPAFLERVRSATKTGYCEFCDAGRAVKKVAIACGAAGSMLSDAIRAGCDTFVTGEARFHTVLEARAAGVNLVLPGHFASERPAVVHLADVLAKGVAGLNTFASEVESDPLAVFPHVS